MKYKDMYKEAQKTGELKAISPAYVSFEKEGQQIVGKLLSIIQVESGLATGTYNQYVVDTDDGVVKFHMGQSTDKEISGFIKIDRVYSFTFLEVLKVSRSRTVNKFRVEQLLASPEPEEGLDKEEVF